MAKGIRVKSILNKHKKRDPWFLDDYSVNPYSGCSFNCIYCYIRGSKYGRDMSRTLSVKLNAPDILEKQLKRRAEKGEYGIIALSTSTEPYQIVEKKVGLTRKLLEIILKYRFPVHILTKSVLVLRDLDLLKEIDEKAILPSDLKGKLSNGVIINFSISTLDGKLAKILEPGAPEPEKRLRTMQKCKEEGFLTGVSYIPILPYITDSEEDLDNMIKIARDYGADFVFVGSLTLFGNKPGDCKFLFYRFLERYHPHLVSKYRDLFKNSFQPPMVYQKELEGKVKRLCVKHGIKNRLI